MSVLCVTSDVPNCRVCYGKRVLPTRLPDGSIYFEDCLCVKQWVEEDSYTRANIPRQYWDCALPTANDKFRTENTEQLSKVENYIQNIDENIAMGRGLWFCSAPGLRKSSIIVAILKVALQKGYRSYFMRVSKAVGIKFDALRNSQTAALMDEIITSVNILALEEIDKVFLSNDEAMNNQLYYEFIADMYESKKSLLVSSNKLPREVLRKYPTFMQDRLRSLTPIVFVGSSERRGRPRGKA